MTMQTSMGAQTCTLSVSLCLRILVCALFICKRTRLRTVTYLAVPDQQVAVELAHREAGELLHPREGATAQLNQKGMANSALRKDRNPIFARVGTKRENRPGEGEERATRYVASKSRKTDMERQRDGKEKGIAPIR